jgi:hypothetical protein
MLRSEQIDALLAGETGVSVPCAVGRILTSGHASIAAFELLGGGRGILPAAQDGLDVVLGRGLRQEVPQAVVSLDCRDFSITYRSADALLDGHRLIGVDTRTPHRRCWHPPRGPPPSCRRGPGLRGGRRRARRSR